MTDCILSTVSLGFLGNSIGKKLRFCGKFTYCRINLFTLNFVITLQPLMVEH